MDTGEGNVGLEACLSSGAHAQAQENGSSNTAETMLYLSGMSASAAGEVVAADDELGTEEDSGPQRTLSLCSSFDARYLAPPLEPPAGGVHPEASCLDMQRSEDGV